MQYRMPALAADAAVNPPARAFRARPPRAAAVPHQAHVGRRTPTFPAIAKGMPGFGTVETAMFAPATAVRFSNAAVGAALIPFVTDLAAFGAADKLMFSSAGATYVW